ncbi:thiamine-phosphate kinase [Castellaniella daejeonensis]|jgi:thiamine-monophosphate kinase|uniref:Thiamine-monophosphate kinase n=1 Tax=Castellaniella daejeonensis TaxID=659013 RepID=A0ABP3D8C3_9BURK
MQADGEFDLIARYFKRPSPDRMLGVGDDCALMSLSTGCELAVSTDMLVEGRHFLPDADPAALGHKALAVNLSDLAAMGARPLACTLALSLPAVDHAWLAAFSEGFHALSRESHCPLVGGDTTRGMSGIVLSVTVLGEVRRSHALRRDAARVGDDVWISGTLGGADLALRLVLGQLPPDPERLRATRPLLDRPTPRLKLGRYLAGVAHAAIDVSDGLLQDLGHVLQASHCGAELWMDALPAHPALAGLDESLRRDALLAGGDAYELCFTARPLRREQIQALGRQLNVPVARVGTLVRGQGVRVLDGDGQAVPLVRRGFDHFSEPCGGIA